MTSKTSSADMFKGGDDEVNCPVCNIDVVYLPQVLRDKIEKLMFGNGGPSYFYDEYRALFKGRLIRTRVFLSLLDSDGMVSGEMKLRVKGVVSDFKWPQYAWTGKGTVSPK